MSCTSQGRSQQWKHCRSLQCLWDLSSQSCRPEQGITSSDALPHPFCYTIEPKEKVQFLHWKELGVGNIFKPVLQLHLTNHEVQPATITPQRKHFVWLQQMKPNGCYWSMGRGPARHSKTAPQQGWHHAQAIPSLSFSSAFQSSHPGWLRGQMDISTRQWAEGPLLAQHPS